MLASSLLSLALVAGSASAAPLAKRGYSGQATYFAVGLGACGWSANDGDYIVALNTAQYGNTGVASGWCGQTITIQNTQNGQTHTATIQDACPSCDYGSLDMSPALFSALNNGNMGEGVFPITWWSGNGGGNSGSGSGSGSGNSNSNNNSNNNNSNNNKSSNNNNNSQSSSSSSSSSSTPTPSSSSSSSSSSSAAATSTGKPKVAPYSAPAHPVSGDAPTGSPNVTFTSQPQWWAAIDPAYCDISVPENVTVAAVGPTSVYNGTDLSDACGKWISIHNDANNKTVLAMVSEWVPEEGTNFLALGNGYKLLADMQGSQPNPISSVTWGFVEHNKTSSDNKQN